MICTCRILLNDQINNDEVGIVWGWHRRDEKCIWDFCRKMWRKGMT